MMNCHDATNLLSQAQDRPLRPTERIGLRLHVLLCRGCARYAHHLAILRAACRHLAGRP